MYINLSTIRRLGGVAVSYRPLLSHYGHEYELYLCCLGLLRLFDWLFFSGATISGFQFAHVSYAFDVVWSGILTCRFVQI